jgi:hypothetical protein
VRYGYEVSDAALPEQLLARLRKDEETVVTDFLTFMFANARDQLTRAGESWEWHILVAVPSQADESVPALHTASLRGNRAADSRNRHSFQRVWP